MPAPPPIGDSPAAELVAVVVPHTHWDREWYAPFETLRFSLVQFLDELIDVLETEPELPAFLLDGQSVILEDYLEVRRDQRDRVRALVRAGRLRPGPFYVQPDEFHASGEALVRNLLLGLQTARDFGWEMREGYLPDTFGHVHQLPQILRGFGIGTFYAMRGFGLDPDVSGSDFWWAAPDGSRVLVTWLTESYSNAAVLAPRPEQMWLHHGALVRYDSLRQLLDRLAARSSTGVLLLLNGGDHLRVQPGVPQLVSSLAAALAGGAVSAGAGAPVGDGAVDGQRAPAVALRLGGLEDFSALVAARRAPELVVRGELRYAARHDVFDGIGSTRTPLKRLAERTEAQLAGVAERLDALATLVDGRSSADSLRYAWRELVKNLAHDSICGCSVDEVHEEMALRYAKVGQVTRAVAEDAIVRIAACVAPEGPPDTVPVVVVNPSAHTRTEAVVAEVVADLAAPLGARRFGWVQAPGVDWSTYRLVGPDGRAQPFTVAPAEQVSVADPLDRRKELRRDRIGFLAADVPALGVGTYRLVPAAPATPTGGPHRAGPVATLPGTVRTATDLDNGVLRVEAGADGTLTVTDLRTGRAHAGLGELLDAGDAGDEYDFGPVPGDEPLSFRAGRWQVRAGVAAHVLELAGELDVPIALTPDRASRSPDTVPLAVRLAVGLLPGADRVEVEVEVDNTARDHRLRLRFPVGPGVGGTALAESAYGLVRRDRQQLAGTPANHGADGSAGTDGWRAQPSGAQAMRRFLAVPDSAGDPDSGGLQILAEGLGECAWAGPAALDVTLLRGVGWLARVDHPLRDHKVGPELATPGAQCLGRQTFRLAVRPYLPGAGAGDLYRAAEAFSVPLQAAAVQRHRRPPAEPPRLGLQVDPAAAVLSAVKTAEDRDGLIVRLFNARDESVAATLRVGFPVDAAYRCDLEETALAPLAVAPASSPSGPPAGTVAVPLAGGQIATVRLHPTSPTTGGAP